MMAPILLLILIIQQLALYESASHSQASRTKVKAIDIVRTINRASGITWKVNFTIDNLKIKYLPTVSTVGKNSSDNIKNLSSNTQS